MEGALTHTVDVGSIPTVGILHVMSLVVQNSKIIMLPHFCPLLNNLDLSQKHICIGV